jgi:hypothetical protein
MLFKLYLNAIVRRSTTSFCHNTQRQSLWVVILAEKATDARTRTCFYIVHTLHRLCMVSVLSNLFQNDLPTKILNMHPVLLLNYKLLLSSHLDSINTKPFVAGFCNLNFLFLTLYKTIMTLNTYNVYDGPSKFEPHR